ncbi:MAG TPA: hypothetical protein VLT16_05070 [Candidatus Limnocylindrales bacterium]|nr:hypothetical protein [Candidatus Limnocylindrales bacterium]
MPDLIVVVDPNYGDRVRRFDHVAPIWIVATAANKQACERLRQERPHHDHREKGAVTSYKATDPEDRLHSLLAIMPQLEAHHGEVQGDQISFQNGFVLELIGLTLTAEMTNALQAFGFSCFVPTPEGFQARKGVP